MASERPLGEQEIKAAFVYNFAKFVTWPALSFPDADTPFVVCTLDDQHPEFANSPLARSFATEVERSIYGKITWRF